MRGQESRCRAADAGTRYTTAIAAAKTTARQTPLTRARVREVLDRVFHRSGSDPVQHHQDPQQQCEHRGIDGQHAVQTPPQHPVDQDQRERRGHDGKRCRPCENEGPEHVPAQSGAAAAGRAPRFVLLRPATDRHEGELQNRMQQGLDDHHVEQDVDDLVQVPKRLQPRSDPRCMHQHAIPLADEGVMEVRGRRSTTCRQ